MQHFVPDLTTLFLFRLPKTLFSMQTNENRLNQSLSRKVEEEMKEEKVLLEQKCAEHVCLTLTQTHVAFITVTET